jgi:hypothetical protein
VANSMMQKFWDSALDMHPAEEFDARRLILFNLPFCFTFTKVPFSVFFFLKLCSDESRVVASESAEGKHIHPPHVNSSFCFKIEDKKGRTHRFSCG